MAKPRKDVGERPTCPDHPGSMIHIEGLARVSANGFYQTRQFRCVHASGRHRLSRMFLIREMTEAHPSAGLPCPKCGQAHAAPSGQVVARQFTYSVLEIGHALRRLGQGGSYTKVSREIRRDYMRTRCEPRPTIKGRQRHPRNMGKELPHQRGDYDYTSPKEPAGLGGNYSQSAATVQNWLDLFGAPVVQAFTPTKMPRAIALDLTSIKRRRWVIDEATGVAKTVAAGERNGELMGIFDPTTSPTQPVIVALEGGTDSESWLRTIAKLPQDKAPDWVVADLDAAIELAVLTAWPAVTLFRCEEHLRKRMMLALAEDGVPAEISRDLADQLGVERPARPRRRRRGSPDRTPHPLYSAAGRSLRTRDDWQAFKDAVNAMPSGKHRARKWILDNDDLILHQFDLKDANPDMPKSTGGVEAFFTYLGVALGERTEFFSNSRRLDLLCNLVALEYVGHADDNRYSEIVTRTIAARGYAGFEWEEGRDIFGMSSIDTLIEQADEISLLAKAQREKERRERTARRRIGEMDARREEAGLPPSRQGRPPRSGGTRRYHAIEKGWSVADIPELAAQWLPELNGGKQAHEVPANLTTPAMWACSDKLAEHGHLHTWKRSVFDRATTRGGCPVCMCRKACDKTSLAALYPDLIEKDWVWDKNGHLDPTAILPGAGNDAWWRCERHGPYEARISSRTKQGSGCRLCAEERRREAIRQQKSSRGSDRAKKARALRAAMAEPATPPIVVAPGEAELTTTDEACITVSAVAALLGRERTTVRNWIGQGRLRAVRATGGGKAGTYFVPDSEVRRICGFFHVDHATGKPLTDAADEPHAPAA